jgi:hypothetical protein
MIKEKAHYRRDNLFSELSGMQRHCSEPKNRKKRAPSMVALFISKLVCV